MTSDAVFGGRIGIKQDRAGYRFSIDAVLLAYHANPGPEDRIVDLGTGCGIIPLMLAYRNPNATIWGVELQKELADTAGLNVSENNMADRISILCRDMKELKPDMMKGPVDLVVSNPPFRVLNSGRINPNSQRAKARHEITVTLSDVVGTARRLLIVSGRLVVIYPAQRITDLLTHMRSAGVEPKFLRAIHSNRQSEAKRVLVEGIKGGRPGMKIGPTLFIYRKDGVYTDEMKKIFQAD
ncbi:tRNA1(Val) (adenine(37)-N6)-methyltransferase [Thermodesulfobacteriota bacterium]